MESFMHAVQKQLVQQNCLLAAVPDMELAEFIKFLEPVRVTEGTVLYRPGDLLAHVYFPTTASISLHYMTEAGATVETGTVGNEGMAGVWLFLGGDSMPSAAVTQSAGEIWRLKGSLLKHEFERGRALTRILLRYTQTLLTQMTLAVACNCHHSLEQRLGSWLLTRRDRSIAGAMAITQEYIASKLGVRREGVTLAMSQFQRAGLIRNSRGSVVIIDAPGLRATACACYEAQQQQRARLLADLKLLGSTAPSCLSYPRVA